MSDREKAIQTVLTSLHSRYVQPQELLLIFQTDEPACIKCKY